MPPTTLKTEIDYLVQSSRVVNSIRLKWVKQGCYFSVQQLQAHTLTKFNILYYRAVLTEVFKKMDSDGSGKLNTKEIIEVLKSEGIYNDDDITAMCTKCKDSDGDQAVNLAEFIEAAM